MTSDLSRLTDPAARWTWFEIVSVLLYATGGARVVMTFTELGVGG